jgi:hypothetical protein
VVIAYPSPAETLRRFTQHEKPDGCCSALTVEKTRHERAFPLAGKNVKWIEKVSDERYRK